MLHRLRRLPEGARSGIDFVILATPPGFRPAHLAAALAAGKHVFTEKPVAVDSAGIRSVPRQRRMAKQKGLAVVAGTQRRHDRGYSRRIERIQGGAIGPVVSGQVYWNQGGLWNPSAAEWTDTEWQIRNWLYFTWLSGDHIVEQHMHNIDVANWVSARTPSRPTGVGGRQSRTDPKYGHIYDHFAIDFEYPNGVHVLSMCRQIEGTADASASISSGRRAAPRAERREARSAARSLEVGAAREADQPVRAGTHGPHREHPRRQASSMSCVTSRRATLTAIMGREAAYTRRGGDVGAGAERGPRSDACADRVRTARGAAGARCPARPN